MLKRKADIQRKFRPALWRLSAMISQHFNAANV